MDKVKIIISPVITVSPVIKVTFNISTIVKIIASLRRIYDICIAKQKR